MQLHAAVALQDIAGAAEMDGGNRYLPFIASSARNFPALVDQL